MKQKHDNADEQDARREPPGLARRYRSFSLARRRKQTSYRFSVSLTRCACVSLPCLRTYTTPTPFHPLAFELSNSGWRQDPTEVRRGFGAGVNRLKWHVAAHGAPGPARGTSVRLIVNVSHVSMGWHSY
jgi:hypothetical protein